MIHLTSQLLIRIGELLSLLDCKLYFLLRTVPSSRSFSLKNTPVPLICIMIYVAEFVYISCKYETSCSKKITHCLVLIDLYVFSLRAFCIKC